MIRNLKVLVAAAMALAAFGVLNASGAQAAAEFHCSVEPCVGVLKPDEVVNTKTSHQVFIIENAEKTESLSFTCGSLSGKAKINTKTSSVVEAGSFSALAYSECLVNGGAALTIDMNGCKYNLTAAGTATITGCTSASKSIEATMTGCTISVPEQGPLGTVSYHNIGTSPNREVTIQPSIKEIKVTASGTQANCGINPQQTLIATQTTGNVIVTGQTEPGVMADAWWE